MADVYRFRKDLFDASESYAVYAASGVSVGSMMQWDPGARKATPMTTASGAIFLGVSEERQPLAGLGTTSQPLTGDTVRVKGAGVHDMKTTASEVYSHLDPVYMGADDQTVSLVGSGRMVGRVHLPGGTQVTGASGVMVPVRIMGSLGCAGQAPSALAGDR